ncbi:MAG: iron-sulfur cluster assembly accessory protein [Myxococcota bacterium]
MAISLSSVLNQQQPTPPAAPRKSALPSLMSVLQPGGPTTPSKLSQVASAPAAPATDGKTVKLTASAAKHVQEMMAKENRDPATTWLRVGVQGGGCSGLSYIIEFAQKPDAMDVELEAHGIRYVVDKKSLLYLGGSELDWVTGLKGHGWNFNNPNEKKGCGCGESFTV